ncbi:hypothetical protein FQA39_LY03991 [Lamprigera yunnana]|nr:hypothetical protein FQA39_LY03991 [Lamprigera yunnana]
MLTIEEIQEINMEESNEEGIIRWNAEQGDQEVIELKEVIEAVSQLKREQYKNLSKFDITYGFSKSKFGHCLIGINNKNLCYVAFCDEGKKKTVVDEMKSDFPNCSLVEDDDAIEPYAKKIFDNDKDVEIDVLLKGTEMQISVWKQLINIKEGTMIDYEGVATAIGKPKAVRSVATTISKNKVAYLLPCHRVINKSGNISKYRWGGERKKDMLKFEVLRSPLVNIKKWTYIGKFIILNSREANTAAVRYKIKKERGFLGWFLLVIPVASFGLGTWQVQRKMWKENLIAELQSKVNTSPVPLPERISDISELEYRRVYVKGQFLHDKELYLGPRSLLQDSDAARPSSLISNKNTNQGFLVITPFKLQDQDQTILVNRGWVPYFKKYPRTRLEGQVDGTVDLIGVVRLNEKRPVFVPSNRPQENCWFYRDLKQMCKVSGADPIFLDATSQFDIKGGPLGGQTRISLRNEHLTYIITWYTLSIFTECDYKTVWKSHLKEHVKIHTGDKYKCKECDYKSVWESQLKEHVKIHTGDEYKCKECDYKSVWKHQLKEHVKIHTGDEYKCEECDYKSVRKRHLKEHVKIHTGEKYNCKECDYKTVWKSHLKEHVKIHTGDKYKCKECDYKTVWKSHLKEHVKIHTGDKYKCKECDYKTVWKSHLKEHVKIHTGDKYKCKECDYKTVWKSHLKEHVKIHTGDEYKCKECDFKTVWKSHLKEHVKIHTGDEYKCKECDYKTVWKSHLKEHVKIHTGDEYKCKECDYKTVWKSHLKEHVKIHTGDEYKCKECDYKTVWKSHLKEHVKIHTGDEYKCKECDYKTVWKSLLKEHVKIHTGDEYTCKECDYKTVWKSNIMKHVKIHSGDKYKCKECDYKTVQKGHLKEHIKIHTGDRY